MDVVNEKVFSICCLLMWKQKIGWLPHELHSVACLLRLGAFLTHAAAVGLVQKLLGQVPGHLPKRFETTDCWCT